MPELIDDGEQVESCGLFCRCRAPAVDQGGGSNPTDLTLFAVRIPCVVASALRSRRTGRCCRWCGRDAHGFCARPAFSRLRP